MELARRGRFAHRAHALHSRLPTALGAGHASASPLHPISIHSTTRSPQAQPLLLLPSQVPPHAQPAPPFPVPSLHHPPAGVLCRLPPLGPAGGVSAGDPSGGGFLLGKDTIQFSSALCGCALLWKDRSFCAARGILIFSLLYVSP